jgi:hypothetical protein
MLTVGRLGRWRRDVIHLGIAEIRPAQRSDSASGANTIT